MNKFRTQDDLLHVAQALKVQAARQELTTLSVAEIKGNVKDGGKGLVDLMFYKRNIAVHIIDRAIRLSDGCEVQDKHKDTLLDA